MWDLDHKESWVPKNWCFWTAVLEKTLDSPLDCKEIKPVHSKENRCWIFIRRTDAEAEAPILWPPDEKSWLIRKDPDAGKDWGQEKGMTEDQMVGWPDSMHMSLNKPWEMVKDREARCAAVHEVTKSQTRLSHWTTITALLCPGFLAFLKSISYEYTKGYLSLFLTYCKRVIFERPMVYLGLPGDLVINLSAHARDLALILGLGRSSLEGNVNSL